MNAKQIQLVIETKKPEIKEQIKIARRLSRISGWRQLFFSSFRPWIFVLGMPKSGKTSLLRNSHCQQYQSLQLNHRPVFRWWLCQENNIVMVDSPAEFTDYNQPAGQTVWLEAIKKFKKLRKQRLCQCIIIVIDVSQLKISDEFEFIAIQFSHLLYQLQQPKQAQSIQIVLSQCDRIFGFNEFFKNLTKEERSQSLGFSLPPSLAFDQAYQQQASAFLVLMNQQLISRLHHEQNGEKRARMLDFPNQLEQLLLRLNMLLLKISLPSNCKFHGIYFTSSQQSKEAPIHFFAIPLQTTLGTTFGLKYSGPVSQQTFFIEGFFQEIFDQLLQLSPKSRVIYRRRLLAVPLALLLMAAGSVWFYQNYHANQQFSRQLLNDLRKNTANIEQAPLPWLKKLDILNLTITQLKKQPAKFHLLLETAQQSYQQLLSSELLRYADQTITHKLQSDLTSDRLGLYQALRIYLMLTERTHFDAEMIQSWFQQQWRQQFPDQNDLQNSLSLHLDHLLKSNILWPKNQKLIDNARQILRQMPIAALAFFHLVSEFSTQPVENLAAGIQIPGFDINLSIENMYSDRSYQHIYDTLIPQLVERQRQLDWVIGLSNNSKIINSNDLIRDVRALYLFYYDKEWSKTLEQISVVPTVQNDDIVKTIQQMTEKNSNLTKFLKSIISQIHIEQLPKETSLLIKKITALQEFINQQPSYAKLNSQFIQLSNFINDIASSSSPNQTAYVKTVERFQSTQHNDPITQLENNIEQLPTPIKQWVEQTSQNSWNMLLKNSREYLNAIWQTTVVEKYKPTIENRYPIFQKSKIDINLKDFTDFFGPDGAVDAFFSYYLKPFVDLSSNYWTWNKVDGQTIGISQLTLEMLLRASMIQQMFFSENRNQPSFSFHLKPQQYSQILLKASLNMEGETVNSSNGGSNDAIALQWQGPTPGEVSIHFTTQDGDTKELSDSGQWAFFRLIDAAEVKTTSDPKKYHITFRIGFIFITYEMLMNNPINPFLPNILTAFRCPESLL